MSEAPGNISRQVTSGSRMRISAAEFNRWQKAAVWADEQQRSEGLRHSDLSHGPQVITVRNDSGAELPQFTPMSIGAPLVTPTDDIIEFSSIPVFSADYAFSPTDVIGIIQEPLGIGMCGECMLSGVTPALLTVTASGDKYASPNGASARLTTGPTGQWRVIWAEPGTGDKMGMVLFSPSVEDTHPWKIYLRSVSGSGSGSGGIYWQYMCWDGDMLSGYPYHSDTSGLILTNYLGNSCTAYKKDWTTITSDCTIWLNITVSQGSWVAVVSEVKATASTLNAYPLVFSVELARIYFVNSTPTVIQRRSSDISFFGAFIPQSYGNLTTRSLLRLPPSSSGGYPLEFLMAETSGTSKYVKTASGAFTVSP